MSSTYHTIISIKSQCKLVRFMYYEDNNHSCKFVNRSTGELIVSPKILVISNQQNNCSFSYTNQPKPYHSHDLYLILTLSYRYQFNPLSPFPSKQSQVTTDKLLKLQCNRHYNTIPQISVFQLFQN